jgi:hypothetical protein
MTDEAFNAAPLGRIEIFNGLYQRRFEMGRPGGASFQIVTGI